MKFEHDIFECRHLVGVAETTDPLALAKAVIENPSAANIAFLIGAVAKKHGAKTKRRTRLDPLKWVALAARKDKTRPELTKMYSIDGKLVATDGYRIHELSYDEAPDKCWLDPKSGEQCSNDGYVFPPYTQAIPLYATKTPISITNFKPVEIHQNYEVWALPLPHDKKALFNAQYVCDAFGKDTGMLGPDLEYYDQLDCLKLMSLDGERLVSLMPMRG